MIAVNPKKPDGPGMGDFHLLVCVLPVLCIAALLRFQNIDASSLWLDEVLQARVTQGPLGDIWSKSPANKPPLDYYLQAVIMPGGSDEAGIRLHALLAGIITVAAIGWWGSVVAGRGSGLVAMILLSGLPLAIRFSQEGRPYSMMLLAECLFLAQLSRLIIPGRITRPSSWIMLGSSLILCIWTQYLLLPICFMALLLGGIKVCFDAKTRSLLWNWIVDGKGWRVLILVTGIVVVSLLPLVQRMGLAAREIPFAPFDAAGWSRVFLYIDLFVQGYEYDQYTSGGWKAFLVLLLSGMFGAMAYADLRWPWVYTISLFALNLGGIFLFFRAIDHWMVVRYTLCSLPPAVMLFTIGLVSIGRFSCSIYCRLIRSAQPADSRTWFLIILLAASCLAASAQFVLKNPVKRTDLRGVCNRVKDKMGPETMILCGDTSEKIVVDYYLERLGIRIPTETTGHDSKWLNHFLMLGRDLFSITRETAPLSYLQSLGRLPEDPDTYHNLDFRHYDPSVSSLHELTPLVQLTSPSGGEIYNPGAVINVKWETVRKHGGSAVRIGLWREGALVHDFGTDWNEEGKGCIEYGVPEVAAGMNYRLRVTSLWLEKEGETSHSWHETGGFISIRPPETDPSP